MGEAISLAHLLPLLLVVLLGTASGVSAHPEFVSSTPSPYDIWTYAPTTVTVTLSEAVQPGRWQLDVRLVHTNGSALDFRFTVPIT